jgi:hypothetical protein
MSSRPFPPSAALCSPCRIVLNEIEYVERIRERIVLRDREKLVGWLSSQQPAAVPNKLGQQGSESVVGRRRDERARAMVRILQTLGMNTNTMDGNTWTRTPSQPHLRQLWRLEAWLLPLFFIRSLFCLYSLAVGCVHCCRPDHRRTESSYLKQCGRRACQ